MKTKIYKKWWFWVIIIAIIVAIATSQGNKKTEPIYNGNKDTTKAEQNQKQPDNQATEKPAEKPKETYLKAGMYKVGQDIPAAEYVIYAEGPMAYMQVSKDSSGSLESIVCNDNFDNRVIVTVKDGEYLQVQNAKFCGIDKAPKVEAKDGKLPSGMYKVGLDLPAGEYKITALNELSYVEVASNSSHQLDTIISNDNFQGEKYVTVKDGQYIKFNGASLKLK